MFNCKEIKYEYYSNRQIGDAVDDGICCNLVFHLKRRKRMTEIMIVTETVPAVCSRKETERTANLM